jgi:hypothetical protein
MWQSLAGGVVIAVSSYFVVLFGLRGITRIFVWMGDGFKVGGPA